MTWDAKKMRILLNDGLKRTADEVLKEVMDIKKQPAKEDEHFFEVVMINVISPDLLNPDTVREYFSFEIPVPYPNKFMFYQRIYAHAKDLGEKIEEYNVFVNSEQVFKGYGNKIYSGGKPHDEIKDVFFQDFYDENEKLMAWMWFGISSLKGQIKPQDNLQRGLRLRKNNIQIGNSGTLRELFKDHRGNEYFIGEVFAVHPDLIPNARRDYFNENTIRITFETKLKDFFSYLWKLCNIASNERNAYKSIKDYRKFLNEYKNKKEKGFSGGVDKETMQTILEEKLKKAEKGQRTLKKSKESQDDEITARIKSIVRASEETKAPDLFKALPKIPSEEEQPEGGKKQKTVYITDELSQYPKETRRVVGRIYDLINQNVPNIAQDLIAKIHAGLKAAKKD